MASDGAPCAVAGCGGLGTKICSRCGVEAYCSAECQRKAWKTHKNVCLKVESPENEIEGLLKEGRLYSAREKLRQLSRSNARLEAEWEERATTGILSEMVDRRLKLAPIEGFGMGYVATRDIAAGEALLFDTAFVSAPIDGKTEFYALIAERALRKARSDKRRTCARADAQADFYYDRIKALPTKASMDRAWLDDEEIEAEKRETILMCSIAEGSCLQCTEDPTFMALFSVAAMFNHSCAPNATLESTRTTALIRAATAIPAQTEVTISYLPAQLLGDVGSRRLRLEAGRGFTCRCKSCIDSVGASSEVA